MKLEGSEGEGLRDAVPSPALAVITRDDPLVDGFHAFCSANGSTCLHFKSGSKFLKKAGEERLFAIVWDQRVEAPDWEALALLPPDVSVIVLGDACPPPSAASARTVLNVAVETGPTALANAVKLVEGSWFLARRLAAAEKRLMEGSQCVKALKEHLEFYEMQRNQLTEVVRKTAFLGQLSKEINCLDIDKIVNICVTKVPALVDASRASVFLLEPETGELVLKQSNHPHRITDRIVLGSSPPTLMALAVDRKATLLIRDLDSFIHSMKKSIDRTHAKKYVTRSCIVVPLMNDNQVLAVLNLADKTTGAPFDEVRDLPLVDHISQFIGIALRNCQLYQRMWRQAKTDSLTGFVNHNAFFDELHREIARAQGSGADLSLVLMDVDNFKLFNDIHGHQVGDMILGQVSQTIHRSVRSFDIAARYGGDEFAIILGDTDLERAALVAERIRRAVAENQLSRDGESLFVTVSAGIAQYRKGRTLADLINEADAALYKAKSRGRNVVATPAS